MSEEKKTENQPKADEPQAQNTPAEAPEKDAPKAETTQETPEAETTAVSEPTQETSATPKLEPGMTVRVHQRIKDVNAKGEEKERIQVFEGTIIALHKKSANGATFTIRKVSNGVGVEKIFPIHLPTIEKWEVVKKTKTRRAKLYFLRDWKKRLKEIKM